MGDLLKIPFPDNSFDFSMSLGVLHHLPADCLLSQKYKQQKRSVKFLASISDGGPIDSVPNPDRRQFETLARSGEVWEVPISILFLHF